MLTLRNDRDKSFCPAKWDSLSIDLENQTIKSCHYPRAKKVKTSDLEQKDFSFHQLGWLDKARSQMLSGKRPSECHYCWNLEDQNLESPRQKWIHDDQKKIRHAKSPLKRLEISFSSICQLSCSYCNAQTSQSIANEYEKFGPYFFENYKRNTENQKKIEHVFWNWLEKNYFTLRQLRITGGEPLLSTQMKDLLNFIESRSHDRLNLAINSNLSFPTQYLASYLDKINELIEKKKIKSLAIFTSLDTWGEQGAYIRSGLNLKLWLKSINLILEKTSSDIIITNTFSTLSIESIDEYFINLAPYLRSGRVKISFSKLQYPRYLCIDYAPLKVKEIFVKKLKVIETHETSRENLRDLSSLLTQTSSKSSVWRKGFFWQLCLRHFLFDYDLRKKTVFKKVFPLTHNCLPHYNHFLYSLLKILRIIKVKIA